MASLYERERRDGTKVWRVEYRHLGHASKSKTFERKGDALNYKRRVEREYDEVRSDPNRISHHKRLHDVIAVYRERELPKMKASYTHGLGCDFWKARLGHIKLGEITAPMIKTELAKHVAAGRAGATANRKLTVLSGMLKFAINELGWLQDNPCRLVSRYKDAKRRERTITAKEWDALLEAADVLASTERARVRAQQLPAFLLLLYATGMRKGEAEGLRWRDVDLDNMRIQLRDTKNGLGRTVPLDQDTRALLLAHQQQFGTTEWVFPNEKGDGHTVFDGPFREAREKAKLGLDDHGEPLVLHSLRHSFATEVAQGGATLVELMAATGHKSVAAAERYLHPQEHHARSAVSKRQRAT
ncbi:MAG: site-specific integrase [Pseudomonadaceae bacterium]|nr:site-specific integrase [Pseudomonadaceae bacterium]